MTLQKAEHLTPESLANVRDRSLEAAYESHDVGMDIIKARLDAHGFVYEDHGDEARHADEIFYGDGPDIAVYRVPDHIERNDDGLGSEYINTETGEFVQLADVRELVFYIEVKTKEDPEWFGRCNLRHFNEYVEFSRNTDKPVFIWFAYLDSDSGQLHRDAFIEITDTDQIDKDVVDVGSRQVVFDDEDVQEANGQLQYIEAGDIVSIHHNDLVVDYLPWVHGNEVVELNNKDFRSFPHVLSRIQ